MFVRRVWPASPFQRAATMNPLRLRRDMDRLFDLLSFGEEPSAGVFPAMNVTQDDDRYFVRAELPGVQSKDLQISVERNKLSLSGKRDIPEEGKGVSYHRRERAGGAFSRSVTLPDELNADAVDATYTSGVLTIVAQKAEAAKARQIQVLAG